MREKDFAADAPVSALLHQNEEVRISGSTPISGLNPGHSGISSVLDAYHLSLKALGRPTLPDERAEFLDCPFNGLAAIRAGYSCSLRKGNAH
jgi:hypothetical protein